MTRIVSVVALSLVLPIVARAQEVPPEASAVPVPLVSALITAARGGADGSATYYVGALPPGWPETAAAPASASVVGGMADRGTLIAVFDSPEPRVVSAFDSLFESRGWRRPKFPTNESGFQSSTTDAGFLCRDSATVSTNSAPSPRGHHYIQVRFTPRTSGSWCSSTQKKTVIPGTLELPRLLAPKGSYSLGGGGHGGQDEQLASAVIERTTLTPRELLEHYASQLTAAGWTALPIASTERSAVQPFDARNASGDPWSGSLFVTSRGKALDVTLWMHRVKP